MTKALDHGGNLDAAVAEFGGARSDWIDLSTGINPVPYPLPAFGVGSWAALPDRNAFLAIEAAARDFWDVPADAAVLAAPGCSALIAQIPTLRPAGTVAIIEETYNEHRAAFVGHDWAVCDPADRADAHVAVYPNNPTGAFHQPKMGADLTVIDESFCDIAPEQSLIDYAADDGVIVLKSFGKFWGLAGLRLGFAIGDPALIAGLRQRLGPWAVSGPALDVGTAALHDTGWAETTRRRLASDALQLDRLFAPHVDHVIGDVSLFRTYVTSDAKALHQRLAKAHIWTRLFPYAPNWIRVGLPAPQDWTRLEAAL